MLNNDALSLEFCCPFKLMKFTLTYDGLLPSASSGNTRTKEKWDIRNHFHPQLAELWKISPVLKRLKEYRVPKEGAFIHVDRMDEKPADELDWAPNSILLCDTISRGGNQFLPLIRKSLDLVCSLKIIFLRRGEPGALIADGGDLDNRIKTLFDALRMPIQNECNGGLPVESPLYCLLEDDALISEFSISTDRLLSAKQPASAHPESEVRLNIEVSVKVLHARSYTMALLGD